MSNAILKILFWKCYIGKGSHGHGNTPLILQEILPILLPIFLEHPVYELHTYPS